MVRGPGCCASMWPQGGGWSQGAKALQYSRCLLCHFRTTQFKRPMPITGNDVKPLRQDNLEGAHFTDTSLRGRKGCDPSIYPHPWSQSHCYWKQLSMRHPALNEAVCVPVATPSLASVTFSISCLNVVNTSLLLERVFWNSSNFSVYRASWARKKPTG